MFKKLSLLLLLHLIIFSSIGKENKSFLIVKEIANFVLQDSVNNKIACDTCNSIASLIKHSKNQENSALGTKIQLWSEYSTYKNDDFSTLSRNLLKEITKGDKQYRKRDKNWTILNENLNSLTNNNPNINVPEFTNNHNTHDVQIKDSTGITQPPPVTKNVNSLFQKILLILPFLFSFLAFLTSVIIYLKFNKFIKMSYNQLKKEIHELTKRIEALELLIKQAPPKPESSNTEDIKNEKDIPFTDETASSQIQKDIPGIHKEEIISKPIITVKYAKVPSGLGIFHPLDLITEQDGERIYELHINKDSAILKLSNDLRVQNYVLSMNPEFYFKEDICNISGTPQIGKKVSVLKDGTLEFLDGIWKIKDKISIKFQ
ncbi:MAG: hypothetical protein U0T69_10855 [Chitinophagales bacterium]